MPTFKFAKLVRDKIVDQQIASGATPTYRLLTPAEHKHELLNKLIEEAREVEESSAEEVVDELADLQQIIDDLRALYTLHASDVAAAQKRKKERSGGFTQGLYIESLELDEGNQWVAYYRRHGERYKEQRTVSWTKSSAPIAKKPSK